MSNEERVMNDNEENIFYKDTLTQEETPCL